MNCKSGQCRSPVACKGFGYCRELNMGKSFHNGKVTLHAGDCLDVLKAMPGNSIDAVVTDPPYHLTNNSGTRSPYPGQYTPIGRPKQPKGGFMGKVWDGGDIAFQPELWAEVLRVLKPGGHMVCFGGTRTYHRMAVAIEDAGFEIRDQLAWVYGSGFPKSHSVPLAIDKINGASHRAKAFNLKGRGERADELDQNGREFLPPYEPASDAARQWQGWGTALKPSFEPILFGSKPVTVEQHFAIIVAELNAILFEVVQCLNVSVIDAERRFCAIQAKCEEAAHSVLASAKIRSLESIGLAWSAEAASTSNALASIDLIKTKGCSALSHVRLNGRLDETPETKIPAGEAVDILTRLMGMSTSAMTERISESTVESWLSISGDLLNAASKFTIEMASRLTIALRTWNSSLLPNITDGTGNLSPKWEPICLARKPLSESTVAANVLRWGTGAINIDATRIGTNGGTKGCDAGPSNGILGDGLNGSFGKAIEGLGRWPANLCHDGSPEVMAGFPETTQATSRTPSEAQGVTSFGAGNNLHIYDDATNSAARFFYTAKADWDDRLNSKHPTVKPVDLMQWLVRLVCPKGATVLDPFAGTGTTGAAAFIEGSRAVLIEREAEYLADIERRMELLLSGTDERSRKLAKPDPIETLPLFS